MGHMEESLRTDMVVEVEDVRDRIAMPWMVMLLIYAGRTPTQTEQALQLEFIEMCFGLEGVRFLPVLVYR